MEATVAKESPGPDLAGANDLTAVSGPERISVTVMLERAPGALARVFALLCTLNLVPVSTCSLSAGEDAIRLDLALESVPAARSDLLLRKLAQMIECLEVRHVRNPATAVA